jgi:hypothetical protein
LGKELVMVLSVLVLVVGVVLLVGPYEVPPGHAVEFTPSAK